MWVEFALSVAVAACLLELPGVLLLRAFGVPRLESLGAAAPISVALFSLFGIVLGAMGVLGVFPVLLSGFAVSLICAVKLLVGRIGLAAKKDSSECDKHTIRWKSREAALAVLVVVLSSAVMGYYFVLPLDSADSFIQVGDNASHMNYIASMVNGGSLSALDVSQYGAVFSESQMPSQESGAFYPNGWHIFVSFVSTMCGANIPLAENAVNFVFSAIVFPLGVYALLYRAFDGDLTICLFGSVVSCAGVAFPLRALVIHQIYPNVAGFCCVFSAVALGVALMKSLELREHGSIRWAVGLVASVVGIALLHPNACFVVGIFLVSYAAFAFVPVLVDRSDLASAKRNATKVIAGALVLLAAMLIWLLLLNSPAMSSVVNYLWQWTVDPLDSLKRILTLGLRYGLPQYVLAILVFAAFIYGLTQRRGRWLAVSFLVMCVIFFCGAVGDPSMKRLFAGFWYTDPERTSAIVAIAAVPLAAYCLNGLYGVLVRQIERRAKGSDKKKDGLLPGFSTRRLDVLAICLAIVSFTFLYFPASRLGLATTALEENSGELSYVSNEDSAVLYNSNEQAFVQKALELIPKGALVLNMPYDGSRFSYPVNGMNVYYKTGISLDSDSETQASEEIRLHLADLSESDSVKDAVLSTGARYVILLNDNPEKNQDSNAWDPNNWAGFEGLDDNPAFGVLLAEGDMRLYEIQL